MNESDILYEHSYGTTLPAETYTFWDTLKEAEEALESDNSYSPDAHVEALYEDTPFSDVNPIYRIVVPEGDIL
jgi:hypothetical protein